MWMEEYIMTEEKIMKKVVLVGVELQHEDRFEYEMEELKNLALACDLEPVKSFTQKGERLQSSHYVGKGKLEEIAEYIHEEEIDAVLFNDELSPSQLVNIEELLECEILDRTLLILDIFAQRAKTKEAQLQVDISRLKYKLPRLEGLHMELGRQGGGAGLTNRGAGETKLELDKRRIESQISRKEKELEKLVQERKIRRERRKKANMKTVALVGYTNAGKSTLMNALAEKTGNEKLVFVKDMLFATLETKVRRIELADKKEFLLTDTVGFVDKLPHHLVKAFRSTLEEVKEADLLLHVIDYSSPFYKEQMKITLETLQEIGVEEIPMLDVYNKIDMVDFENPNNNGERVWISAKTNQGIDTLLEKIKERLFHDYEEVTMLIPYEEGRLLSSLNEHYEITATDNKENGTLISFSCPHAIATKYEKYLV